MKIIEIKKNDVGQRIDKFLNKSFSQLTKSSIYKYIRKKRIKINNKRCYGSDILKEGDKISLYINDEELENKKKLKFIKANSNINVIYEDSNILIIDKPAGLLSHEGEKTHADNLIDRIKKYLYEKGEYNPFEEISFKPSLINRLDFNTRGIVVAAKNFESLKILNEKLKYREIKKFYLCLVSGIMEKKTDILKAYLKKNKNKNKVYVFDRKEPESKHIITKYRVLKEYNRQHSLLEIELLTGRSHQIRAHMAYIKHPVIGDIKYIEDGDKKENDYNHQALISYKIVFKFKTDAGILNYLKDKSYMISNIDFNI